MARVRRRGTEPELVLRKALWANQLRYRLNSKTKLPGSPDILFPGCRIAIFVDGCFWHGCPLHGTSPKTNSEFWAAKIQRNKSRDTEVDKRLIALGWTPLHIWEHEIKEDMQRVIKHIKKLLEKSSNQE
jgi:DNA mismatch endonuclease, patch repair protein